MNKHIKREAIYGFAKLHLEQRTPARNADYDFLLGVLKKMYRNKIHLILDIVGRCVVDLKLHGEIVRYK